MSSTIVSVFVTLLAMILPYFGVSVGSDQLTQAAQTIIVIGAGIWIWYQRFKKGDITPIGVRK